MKSRPSSSNEFHDACAKCREEKEVKVAFRSQERVKNTLQASEAQQAKEAGAAKIGTSQTEMPRVLNRLENEKMNDSVAQFFVGNSVYPQESGKHRLSQNWCVRSLLHLLIGSLQLGCV